MIMIIIIIVMIMVMRIDDDDDGKDNDTDNDGIMKKALIMMIKIMNMMILTMSITYLLSYFHDPSKACASTGVLTQTCCPKILD